MQKEKEREKIEETKGELIKEYAKNLDEIFEANDRPLTFDEIEKVVDKKLDTNRNEVIEKIIETEQEKKICSNGEPEETSICVCGTEVMLCRDEKGNPKTFERELQTKKGHVKLKEYGYYCTNCRKIFFPSKKGT